MMSMMMMYAMLSLSYSPFLGVGHLLCLSVAMIYLSLVMSLLGWVSLVPSLFGVYRGKLSLSLWSWPL